MRSLGWICLFLILVLGMGSEAYGQPDPDYQFVLSNEETFVGVDAVVTLSFTTTGEALAGWSIGVCHDELVTLADGDVVEGAVTAIVNEGDSPDFDAISVLANSFTVGCVVNFMGSAALLPGTDLEMYLITYGAVAEGTSAVEFCATGSPITENAVVVGVTAFTPVQTSGTIEIAATIPTFTFALPDVAVEYKPDDGLATIVVSPTIIENPAALPDTYPNSTGGFSMGIDHDETFLAATSLVPAGPVADLNGGAGPEYFAVNLDASDTGVTLGVVYVLFGDMTIAFAAESPVVEITYDTIPAALIGDEVGVISPLVFSDSLGSPPVRNTAVIDGFSQDVILDDGSIQLVPILIAEFIRGECMDDGVLNLVDGLALLNVLFLDFPIPACPAACDVNGNRALELVDAVVLFNYLFLLGPPPPPPFPDCGDTTNSDEICEVFETCE